MKTKLIILILFALMTPNCVCAHAEQSTKFSDLVDPTNFTINEVNVGHFKRSLVRKKIETKTYAYTYIKTLLYTRSIKRVENSEVENGLRIRLSGHRYDGHFIDILIPSEKKGFYILSVTPDEYTEAERLLAD